MHIEQIEGDMVLLADNEGIAEKNDPDPKGETEFKGPAEMGRLQKGQVFGDPLAVAGVNEWLSAG